MYCSLGGKGMQKNSGLAIASMILGIISIIFSLSVIFAFLGVILGIVGLVLGIVGKSQIKMSQGEINGNGMALAGIICSSISLGIVVLTYLACAAILSVDDSMDYYYFKLILSRI